MTAKVIIGNREYNCTIDRVRSWAVIHTAAAVKNMFFLTEEQRERLVLEYIEAVGTSLFDAQEGWYEE
jgi:hypothetical protein